MHNIMNEERGAALRLLYQLKLGLDKHFSQSDVTVTGLKQRFVNNKINQIDELKTTLKTSSLPTIKKQYGVVGPTFNGTNAIIIENKLLQYEVARANLEKKAADDDHAEKNLLQSMQQSKRQEAIRKMNENK